MIRRILVVGAKAAAVLVAVAILYFAITFVQIWLRGHEHTTKDAQAILVFGTAAYDASPSPELRARLDQALALYDEHRAPWIAVTGGSAPGDAYTEARVSATYLETPRRAQRRGSCSARAPIPGRTSRACSGRCTATTSPR